MQKANGLRKYLYEYIFHQAVEQARDQTSEIVPISQAKSIRARVDEILSQRPAAPVVPDGNPISQSMAHPRLSIPDCLSAIDQALTEAVPDYEPQFGIHTGEDPRYQELQSAFMRMTEVGKDSPSKSARLPISPYDPSWSERASVKRAGTALLFVPDETIGRTTEGRVDLLAEPQMGSIVLWGLDDDGKAYEAGRAMTNEDASGLTALMDKMSQREYEQVRGWVIDGGRDPRTGRIDRNRFMSAQAVARSAAILEELKSQGIDYEVVRDREPGQIKARIAGTTMEVRLTDTVDEAYAGARIYDNGMVTRYSTNYRVPGGNAVHSPTPEEAVQLLRFAQGQSVERADAPGRLVGQLGTTHTERDGGRTVDVPDGYYDAKSRESMFVVDDFSAPGRGRQQGAKLMIRREAKERTLPTFFVGAEPAEEYAAAAVASARENLQEALDAEQIITHFETQRAEGLNLVEFEPPEYSADPEIAAIQRTYWGVLTGEHTDLLRPGATAEMYAERLEEIGELGPDEAPDMGNLVYGGSAAEKIRAHADDVPFELIGTWEAETHFIDGDWVDQRFDPARVAKYMTSPTGQWSNLDSLAAALRAAEVSPDEMMGTGFQAMRFKDRIVRFDLETSVPMAEHPSPFVRRMGEVVADSLARNAATIESVRVDEQGVVSWSGARQRRNGRTEPVSGEIGQIFDVGEHGEIVTGFASGENALIVPGYEARIAAPVPGQAPSSVEERTILRGYEQLMTERIRQQVAGDLMSGRSRVGEPASLNGVYSQLYGTKHPADFIEKATSLELDEATGEITERLDEWTASILETEARRVRYSNEVKQSSTIYAEYRAQRDRTDPADDNRFDAWRLTGGRNMAVLTGTDANRVAAPGGYFDPVMTGGAINQGIVRYLTADAEVSPDGRIVPGDPETLSGSRTPLMTRPELETLRYDAWDRQQMTASTIMQSSEVTEPTGTALMTFGGWTADDPIVVSKGFAEAHRIRGAGGQERALVVGDKLSDLHGNKGVLSLIVDRTMPLEEAREQGIEQEVAYFQANPDMDVVMSPFSLISRRNAGSARELMDSDLGELRAPEPSAQDRLQAAIAGEGPEALAQPTPGGLGRMRFVVTHMAVDEKTKIYDDEQVRAGKGRKASSQLAWALQSQDCPAIMREFYGHNSGAESNLREHLLVTGVGLTATGELYEIGEGEQPDVERRLIPMPELQLTKPIRHTGRPALNTTSMRKAFGRIIGDRGGDMELPFPLTFPTERQTEQVSATSWKLPVLSSHLRSGQEFDDGTSVTHDYTRNYQDVFIEACRYRFMTAQLNGELPGTELTAEERTSLRQEMSASVSRAQRSFEAITTDVKGRVLSGKSNAFKTGLMSSRLSDSATMVWTGDPRLDIDQIALGSAKAEQLGLAEGDHALVWRDPVLRDAGVRYMRVAIDDRLTGAAINPVMDQCFDGDFDGDAVAVVKLHSEAAKEEALLKLSVPANLLDTGVVKGDGSHPLAMQVSLDTQVALSKDPELAEEFTSAEREANRLHRGMRSGEIDAVEATVGRDALTEELSDLYRQAQSGEFGSALSFTSAYEHVQSVQAVCVNTGAKGSLGKLSSYADKLGLQVDDAGGWYDVDHGEPGITAADQEASMFATAIKAHGTGLGGSFSQRAVRALRGDDLKAVLEVTYPVTQSILQAKHDAAEARHKYEMLQGPGRDLWRGRRLEHVGPGQWRPEFVDGEPIQATAAEWEAQFVEFYESKEGFGVSVNPDHVARVARALEDPSTGLIRNLEEDPSLAGCPMDRMAYGGDFSDLVQMAKSRENVWGGEKSAQFVSAPTRRILQRREAELAAEVAGIEVPDSPAVLDEAVKRDVLADDADKARLRGANRRSAAAVGVTAPTRPAPRSTEYRANVEETTAGDGDYGLGG